MIDLHEIKNNHDWSGFSEVDSFNGNNLVEGYICRTSNDYYGALFIEKVNYRKVPQLILCTPKLR